MSAIVIPRIFGGLGNQLFIYAAARRLAIFNNSELILDDVSGFEHDYQFRRNYQLDHFAISCLKATPRQRLEPFSRIRRNLMRRWNQYVPLHRKNYLVQEGKYFDARILNIHPQKYLYLEGYWQSELYFKDIESQLRKDLCLVPPTDFENLALADRISASMSVAVHVRFFENSPAVVNHSNKNISANYYQQAICALDLLVPGTHYYVFSDRPDEARSYIPLPDHRVTLIKNNKGDLNVYADLWLMTKCQHFIIANSTLSWWGAWLALNKNKLVFAPKLDRRLKGSWDCPNLLPHPWIQL
jgi:hypothetical protein